MSKRLLHPLWTHLPAAGLVIYLVVRLVLASPLPEEVPIHFGINGQPNSWGSPWSVFGLTLGLSLLFLAISIILDEAWVRHEKKKSFNWLCFLDELTVGMMVGISLGHLRLIESGLTDFDFPMSDMLLTAGIAVVLAFFLELLRPFRPNPHAVISEDTALFEKELQSKLKGNPNFIYYQSQNPLWVNLLSILLPVVMIVVAALVMFEILWMSIVYVILGFCLVTLYSGMRTIITPEKITVRLGIFGYRLLKVNVSEIAAAEVMEFSPIKDFGGYGIRFNKKMWAYFMRGGRGVKLTLVNGMQYLIGADRPEQMLAVVRALTSL